MPVSQAPIWLGQLTRYLFAGALVNGALYVFYLVATTFALHPAIAATLAFALGAALSFRMHSSFTFRFRSFEAPSKLAFAVFQLLAYCGQMTVFWLCRTALGAPHEIAQAVAMICAAGLLFLAQKHFVFGA
jgi:putative flippase GtrA